MTKHISAVIHRNQKVTKYPPNNQKKPNMFMIALTKDGEFLVSLQGLLSGEGEVKPAGSCQVDLHGASKDLHIGRSPLNSLSTHLHPHACHHH